MSLSIPTEAEIYDTLRDVYDPELGINLVDLGLIYSLTIEGGIVTVLMTLTTPGCPLHETMAEAVEAAIWSSVPGVQRVNVQLVWSPPWNPNMMTEEGKAALGWGY
ncbi:MAG: metal-sulfur cluster assembly factor [Ardenticatenaceae bacterium]|nr:metal-sulfur cluster assembly factor [Ardenticatenaceae bacterium]